MSKKANPVAIGAFVMGALALTVVGLLLFSALMIVPTATAQLVARSFGSTLALAMGIGTVMSSPFDLRSGSMGTLDASRS